MASKKHFLRIEELLLLAVAVLLLATHVTAKRNLVAAPNDDDVGVKGGKVDRQAAQDRPWGGNVYPSPWGGYNPPSHTSSDPKLKT